MRHKIGIIGLALTLAFTGHVIAKSEVTRPFGGACGENDTTVYKCSTGLSCQRGTCGLASELSISEHACKAEMAKRGYNQDDPLNYPAIYGGFCYIDRDTPGMHSAIGSYRNLNKVKYISLKEAIEEYELEEPIRKMSDDFSAESKAEVGALLGRIMPSDAAESFARDLKYVAKLDDREDQEEEIKDKLAAATLMSPQNQKNAAMQKILDICNAHSKSCFKN